MPAWSTPFTCTALLSRLGPTAFRGSATMLSHSRRCSIAGSSRWGPISSWKAMFTGLIETVGELAEIRAIDAGFRLRVLTTIAADLHAGESVAVNGVCLTVVDSSPTDWSAEV